MTATAVALLPVAVAALLLARHRRHGPATLVSKSIASALFLVVAFAEPAGDPTYAGWVRAALVLCALGDVALVGESRRHLAAGIAAFGLGHLGFCVAFAPLARAEVAALLGLPLLGAAGAVLWRVRARLGALAVPAAVYAVLVTATAALGVAAWLGAPGRALVGAGAALFFASDVAVARQRFAADAFVNRLVGVPLYYAATLLLALSVGRLA
ncbi:MAG: lysoplasmalogenase [Planctomycetes bacterium]|nr:lysoplasmalogenase [Planctomycetota bacterium]